MIKKYFYYYVDRFPLLLPIFCLLLLYSCDSRDDWFGEEGKCKNLIVYRGVKGKSVILESDTINVESRSCRLIYYVYPEYNTYSSISLLFKSLENSNLFQNGISYEKECRMENIQCFDSDTSAMEIQVTEDWKTLTDVFGNDYYIDIVVHFMGDCPPIPVLKVSNIDGHPMEKCLSLADSYDKDGEVIAYEWCIDGNVVNYSYKDNRFDDISGVWQGGKAAYGGTYVTSTKISEINHAFQSAGEHVVYYRCMDDLWAWSTWKKETINITE